MSYVVGRRFVSEAEPDRRRPAVTGRDGGVPAKTLSGKLTDARKAFCYADRSWQDELVPKMIDEARRLADEKRPERIRSSREAMRDVMGIDALRVIWKTASALEP